MTVLRLLSIDSPQLRFYCIYNMNKLQPRDSERTMKTRNCENCWHSAYVITADVAIAVKCLLGHKPLFNRQPFEYGWRRDCTDFFEVFREKNNVESI